MDALGFVYTVSGIVGGLFVAWTYTKRGKEWLKNL